MGWTGYVVNNLTERCICNFLISCRNGRIRSFNNSDNSDSSLQEQLRLPVVVQEFGGPFERHNTGTLGFHYALSCELGNLFQRTGDVPALLINLDGRGDPLVANMFAVAPPEHR